MSADVDSDSVSRVREELNALASRMTDHSAAADETKSNANGINNETKQYMHKLQCTKNKRKFEAEREAIVEAEETTALRARFKVTLAELQKAKTEWKEWLAKRSILNFVSK
ncbi:hypothetical protein N0V91_010161 [Didymella pomorum]|uniref:Uncharacterized protein n=1 Tax=Didymella pomorum TaxID=749634 RepID=A0A9W9D2C4_9PLEO|nr:hypothetical protein N0V91_010161 [Didymella pomorum]